MHIKPSSSVVPLFTFIVVSASSCFAVKTSDTGKEKPQEARCSLATNRSTPYEDRKASYLNCIKTLGPEWDKEAQENLKTQKSFEDASDEADRRFIPLAMKPEWIRQRMKNPNFH